MASAEMDTDILRLIDEFGQEFDSAVCPKEISRGGIGMCFDWCVLEAMEHFPSFKYVEGYATEPGTNRLVLHAWLTDGKLAFDPTWVATDNRTGEEVPLPVRYKGIILPVRGVVDFMRKTKYQGVLANRRRAPALVDKMLKTIKSGDDSEY